MRLLKYITDLPDGRKQGLTFLLFVVFSAGIWTVNALNQRHTVKASLPILGDGRFAPAHHLPATVEVELKGRGFDLIPVLTKIGSTTLTQPTGDRVWNIRQAVNNLLAAQGKNIELISVQPASMTLNVTKRFAKRLPVTPTLKILSGDGWVQSGPAGLWPDSLTIVSDNPIPDTLQRIRTGAVELSIASGSFFGSQSVVLPSGLEPLEPSRIWIYVPAERATEARVKAKIHILRPGFLSVPATAEVQCRVPLSLYSQTTPERFIVIAEPDPSDPERALLKVLHAPYWCSQIITQPVSVRLFRNLSPAS